MQGSIRNRTIIGNVPPRIKIQVHTACLNTSFLVPLTKVDEPPKSLPFSEPGWDTIYSTTHFNIPRGIQRLVMVRGWVSIHQIAGCAASQHSEEVQYRIPQGFCIYHIFLKIHGFSDLQDAKANRRMPALATISQFNVADVFARHVV